MTNSPRSLPSLSALVHFYVLVVLATIGALMVLTLRAPHLATAHAWGHAVIVAIFAVLLPLRMRSARAGSSSSGLRAVGIISAVLLLANVVEALIPGFVPIWMRIEMIGIAVLMAASVMLVTQIAARDR